MVLVGEAWGEHEASLRAPFVGASGQELFRMLGEAMPEVAPDLHAKACDAMKYGLAWVRERGAWLAAASVAMTNVLALRPPGNKLEALCGTRAEVGGASYDWPAIAHGKYLRSEFLPEVSRLHYELGGVLPNLIVALGNTACWALLHATNIGSIRGAVAQSTIRVEGGEQTRTRIIKVLPTYHPAGVMRMWGWRPIVVADLMKAAREMAFPEIRRPSRQVLVNGTIEDYEAWAAHTLRTKPPLLSVDIETGAGQIKCVGFAKSRADAMVLPFVDLGHSSGSYWPTLADERRAWHVVNELLSSSIGKLFQNGLYDLQYLTRAGFHVANCQHDTMLLHHSLYPEMQKGLGFLGSIYTNEQSWKLMRRAKADTVKRDE